MQILVADDDEICREVVVHQLSRKGHRVREASDGKQAWSVIRSGDVDAAILDWDMPELRGPDVCRRVREMGCDRYLYVILLTARHQSQSIVEGLRSGADAFASKPISAAELHARVEAAERTLSMESRDLTIFALARLAESRDPETGKHLDRVRTFSRVLAQQLAEEPEFTDLIDGEFIRLVYATSPLHDIGKVGISDSVLLKPGKLTPDEFTQMKEHARIGAETLDAAFQKYPQARFLRIAREIAASHHERWDGTGYPEGLSGEEIPLSARIVSVADVYDALTTKRVYKDAFPHEQAVEIIREGSGTQFDPRIVTGFLKIAEEWRQIARRLSNES